MATGANDLIQFVEENWPTGEFVPYTQYGAEEDALIFYFRDDPDYAKRLNKRVTVFLAVDSHELVGVQIKGVRSVLEDIGWFDVAVNHKGTKLKMLFLAYLGTLDEDPEARKVYRELFKIPDGSLADVNVPEIASAC
jgi:hypothetical protein